MTPTERRAAFDELFDALPGKNIERIRWVCSVLHIRENTVRLYRCNPPARNIPERSLMILRAAMQQQAGTAKRNKRAIATASVAG